LALAIDESARFCLKAVKTDRGPGELRRTDSAAVGLCGRSAQFDRKEPALLAIVEFAGGVTTVHLMLSLVLADPSYPNHTSWLDRA
jgi:hypothetical protein